MDNFQESFILVLYDTANLMHVKWQEIQADMEKNIFTCPTFNKILKYSQSWGGINPGKVGEQSRTGTIRAFIIPDIMRWQ